MKKILIVALAIMTMVSCKKDPKDPEPTPAPTTPAPTTGSITFEFDAKVDTMDLVFNTKYYKNANNDSFNVSIFKYYVSNIVLTKTDNSTYTVSNGYFLVDHATTNKNKFTVSNIPFANYKSVQFMIGVDSLRNVSGAQEGDLAQSLNMFWTWNSGYIFAKMEGTSPQSPDVGNALTFHIGGFKDPNNSIRTTNVSFGSMTANVSASTNPTIHFKSDLKKWFSGANTISFATLYKATMPGANAMMIADNYVNMFSLEHIHN
ncbi:MAG: MbnP family protein [Bacteroidia bacterium]